jgi:signal transduction histidine kinase
VTFHVAPPGASVDNEAVAVGPALPGWELSFSAADVQPAAMAAARRAGYVAVALVAIAAVATAVALAGGAARRQARLASLRTDLVSAVSHELKTPLASMRLLVDALLEDDRLEPVKTREYLQLMSVENARLTRLIDNFLTFSRIERKRQQFTFTAVDPGDVAREAVKIMPERQRGERPPVLDVAPGLPPIHADADALLTVLLNLLDNAYKYTPADQCVSLRVMRDAQEIVFSVHDNGIGIEPQEVKKIFRGFYRVDQRLARTTAGTGLGLSIVRAIVDAHGGHVEVESTPGRGSTFAVYLPCAADGVPA